MEELRPLSTLLGMALVANRRGDLEDEAELRSEIALHQLQRHLSKTSPIVAKHADRAHAILDEAVQR